MKTKIYSKVIGLFIVVVITFALSLNSRKAKASNIQMLNTSALSAVGSSCSGPKKASGKSGNTVCKCSNGLSCSDNTGCN